MQIGIHAAALSAARPTPVIETQPPAPTSEPAPPSGRAEPGRRLFSNGLMDAQGLLASSLVRDVITLTAGGAAAFESPNRLRSSQEHLARQEVASRAGEVSTSGGAPAGLSLTDEDRAFFRQTTGYNLAVFANGVHMVVDDDGNAPRVSAAEADAMGTLAISLMGDRSSGRLEGQVTSDWLDDFLKTYADSDLLIPDRWRGEADDWFLKRSETA